ncbi:helicase-exonuclease AddAB subunit AddA [Listeria newyorkensis]|uniref:ATP-dependent helicase/nuclease subunit A n=1 Tax=Listeria newyorkensis TaxID=1497681 RepID=A0A841Z2A0_9LIST|nr:helicase-exonuclease AddAB subunit AddA [Listeria newyorkensis]MBC1458963.1 helicase-exonuclease AddAB subunit AddA [Listeria newyorkensis]
MRRIIPTKPENAMWTDDQWKAMYASGQNVLVAAAAGSGKTAVLVNRVIEKIVDPENPIDVDELLIVTFTNASAAEMKARIGKAVENALLVDESSSHLKRQIALLNYASISTLHSFCLDVIKKYYYLADIDPEFRLIEPIESAMVRDEVMDKLLEEHYGNAENVAFFELVDTFSGDRSDDDIGKVVGELYDFSRAHPSPEAWLDSIIANYDVGEITDVAGLPFYAIIEKQLMMELRQAEHFLKHAIFLCGDSAGPEPYLVTLESDLEQVRSLMQALDCDWESLTSAWKAVKFQRIATLKNKELYDEVLVNQVKKLRDQAKKTVTDAGSEWFSRDGVHYISDLMKMKHTIVTLIELTKEFAIRFYQEKISRGMLDFNDLEHLALRILSHSDQDGAPSNAALGYQEKFKEVLIDEYQDTNMVQERILSLVTADTEADGNLFMVGDVKQSIYRFRLAEPGLFLAKYKRYTGDGDGTGLKIDLSQNFRSRSDVLDTTNFIFNQLMDTEVAEIEYDEQAKLVLGAHFPDSDSTQTELVLIDMEQDERSDEVDELAPEQLQKRQAEARYIAKRIAKLIDERTPVFDKGLKQYRPMEYRDIVILSRALTSAPDMEDAMKELDIPFYANNNSGYFEATEVAIMVSLLKIIDNPYQDIPLASVLRSPIVSLDEDALARIRSVGKNKPYFEALEIYALSEPGELASQLQAFLRQLSKWRELSMREDLADLIAQIFQETHFYDFVGGLPGGKQRQANLRALLDRANQYEKTAFRGLFRFIRFVERLQVKGQDLGTAKTLGEKEDVVRMMTIHASKGLEFPVVFLSGLDRKFNMRDIYNKYLFDKDFGFATRYNDPVKRLVYPSIMQQAIKYKKIAEMMAEEMRVLYVALTRAEEKLILVGTVPSLEKSVAQWEQNLTEKAWMLPASVRFQAKNYLQWIGSAFVRHPDYTEQMENGNDSGAVRLSTNMRLLIEKHGYQEFLTVDAEAREDSSWLDIVKNGKEAAEQSPYFEQIQERLSFRYGFIEETGIRSKQSVTEVKRQFSVADSFSDTRFTRSAQPVSFERPKFLQEKRLTATERGTAMHTVMQALSLTEVPTAAGMEALLDELVSREVMNEEQVASIQVDSILNFFDTELGQLMLSYPDCTLREIPFSYKVPANRIHPDVETREQIIVQGMIDVLVELDDQLILIDYKTDQITGKFENGWLGAEAILKKRYQVQMDMYKEAIEKINGRQVDHVYLYFFDGNHVCELTGGN